MNLLPFGANSFRLEKTIFQSGIGMYYSKQEVTKMSSLYKNVVNMAENLPIGILSYCNLVYTF